MNGLLNFHNQDDNQCQSHGRHILRQGNRGKGERTVQERNENHSCRDQQGEGQRSPQPLVLLLQADLILIIPEKHFHILSLQIEKKKGREKK